MSQDKFSSVSVALLKMSRLSCLCLNVTIFTSGNDWRSTPIPTLFPGVCEVIKDVETLYEVNLDVAGVVSW